MEAKSKVDFILPNLPSKCTWSGDADKRKQLQDPHKHVRYQRPAICETALNAIGNTPLIKLNRIPKEHGVKCEILAKCEFFNAGGSVKDRIGLRMVEEAEREGKLKPGSTIIEPTSGNTGIGLALAAAIKGYRCIIVMPEKMSSEKANVLHALGAEIVRTPTAAEYDAPDSHISVSYKLNKSIPNSIVLNQYNNPGNPLAHYDTTAEEILEQCDGKVDVIVMGAGTGGTVTGIGRKFKEKLPSCKIIAVDPLGSILAHSDEESVETHYYDVEGIGYDFIPTVLDRSVIDEWIKIGDKESFVFARELIAKEGLLCGGSSGSALAAAIRVAKDLPADKRVVLVLPDSVRNYMTKFLDDVWMSDRDFLPKQENLTQTALIASTNLTETPWYWNSSIETMLNETRSEIVSVTCKISDAMDMMKQSKNEEIGVNNENGALIGIVTVSEIMKKLITGKVQFNDTVERVMINDYPVIDKSNTIGHLISILKVFPYVVVVEVLSDHHTRRFVHIFKHLDVLNYVRLTSKLDK